MWHLVTGGAGHIGSAVCKQLLLAGYGVVALDDLSTGKRSNLPEHPLLRFHAVDVNNRKALLSCLSEYRVHTVFHLAACVGVERTLADPMRVFRDLDGQRNILDAALHLGAQRLCFTSSSEVYGQSEDGVLDEDFTPLNARLPYAIVKCAGEAMCSAGYQMHGLPFTIFRLFNTYGPCQSTDFVIPRFIEAALHDQPLTVRGDGRQTRTFCHVDDTVEAMLRAAFDDRAKNQIINIGSAVETGILSLADNIIRLSHSNSAIQFIQALELGDCRRRRPSNTKMLSFLGREPRSLEQGLAELIRTAHSNFGLRQAVS